MGLGLVISILVFFILLHATQSKSLAFVGGLMYDLLAGQVFFEANLLTETLTSFLIIVSLAIYTKLSSTDNHSTKLKLAMGARAELQSGRVCAPALFFPAGLVLSICISFRFCPTAKTPCFSHCIFDCPFAFAWRVAGVYAHDIPCSFPHRNGRVLSCSAHGCVF